MHRSISISPLNLIDSTNTAAYTRSQLFLPKAKRSTGFYDTVQSNCLSIRFIVKIWLLFSVTGPPSMLDMNTVILYFIIFTSNICTLTVQEAFMECKQYSGSLQHECRHPDFTTDELSSITFFPPPASFLTSTP